MTTTTKLQGTIEQIRIVIQAIGPATARQIETHPTVVAACRSSKAKARRLIERLQEQGHIQSDLAAQQPKYWVQQATEKAEWDYDDTHNRHLSWKPIPAGGGESHPCFTTSELASELGVTPKYLLIALRRDPNAPRKQPVKFLSMRNENYYRGSEVRKWWSERIHTR